MNLRITSTIIGLLSITTATTALFATSSNNFNRHSPSKSVHAVTQTVKKKSVVPSQSRNITFDTHKFMRVSEVRPGMRGYALTVFKGTKIERFDIEILGVVRKFNMGKDYILFKALSGPSVTRGLNIAHGMSGSPIYVNGKLLGAISMGIPGIMGAPSFPKEPMALATPIEEMFDAWSPDLPKSPLPVSATPGISFSNNAAFPNGISDNFSQIDIPVTASGFTSQGLNRLRDMLSPYHFSVVAGSGAGSSRELASDPLTKGATLQPGSAVGIALAQGDIDLTATGTVTYRQGNRLLLFGHPLVDLGPIDAPMTTAYVVDVYPSYQDSIKIGAPLKTVGRIFQDRPFSVGAVIGQMPHMVPVTVNVNDLSIKRNKTFTTNVINHPLLTSRLIALVADQAIQQVHGEPGDSMATVRMDVVAEEIGHIVRTNTFYDAQSIDLAAISDLQSVMQLLSSNPFYPLAVKSVKFNVTIKNRHDTAEIDHIFVKQTKYAPGDTIQIGVALKPFKQKASIHYINVKVPSNTPNGTVDLNVKGGTSDSTNMQSLGGLIIIRQDQPQQTAVNIAQLVRKFNERARNNEVVARILLPTRALNVEGEKLSNLPPTISAIMQTSRSTGLHTERDEVKVVRSTGYVISGSQDLSVTIEKKEITESAHGTISPPPPASSQPAATISSSSDTSPSSSAGREVYWPRDDDEMTMSAVQLQTIKPVSSPPAAPPATTVTVIAPKTQPAAAATPETASASTATARPIGRIAGTWQQDSTSEFSLGIFHNSAITNKGEVILSKSLTKVAETGATFAWCIVNGPDGSLYAGTGDNGVIYKINNNGKANEFYKTGELEVSSLTVDNSGNLYAGTLPNGRVFKISADGHGTAWFTAKEKYITAVKFDAVSGNIYIATGGGTAKVYAVSNTGVGAPCLTTAESHILSLAIDDKGIVYAGTAPNGLVYRVINGKSPSVLYDSSESGISALATDKDGNIYAGTGPRGSIIRIAGDGRYKTIVERTTSMVTSLMMDNGSVYAISGNAIYHIADDESVQGYTNNTDEQFIAQCSAGSGIYITSASAGAIYKLGGKPTRSDVPLGYDGEYISSIYDSGAPSHWGTISWRSTVPQGAAIVIQSRSGDVTPPDNSWSDWSSSYTNPQGEKIKSPQGRYIQYRALFKSGTSDQDVKLDAITIYYLTRNLPPIVRVVSPKSGDAVSKSVNIQWNAADPEKDTLLYDIAISGDNGKTWTPIKKRWKPSTPAAPPITEPAKPAAAPPAKAASPIADPSKQLAEMKANVNDVSQLPPAVRAQILAQAPEVIKQTNALTASMPTTVVKPADNGAANLKETSFAWDSSEMPDGTYIVQVTASDKVSEPDDPQTATTKSGPFTVANTPPALTVQKPEIQTDKTVIVKGSVKSKMVFIKAVQYKLDNTDTYAASADDGIFDSPEEAFTVHTPVLTTGSHTIDITVIDWAGNISTKSVTVVVP